MAVGVSGRHGNHAALRVEEDTGHDFAHAPIQRQNGLEGIALGQISLQRAAICTSVKVDAFKFSPQNDSAFFDVLACSLGFIPELS